MIANYTDIFWRLRFWGCERIDSFADLWRSKAFKDYCHGETYSGVAIEALRALDRLQGLFHDGEYEWERIAIRVCSTIIIKRDASHPLRGSWNEKFVVHRGEWSDTVNLLVLADNGRRPQFVELVPGMTAAHPEMIHAILKENSPERLAAVAGVDCPASSEISARVYDTSEPFDDGTFGDPVLGPSGRIWREIWTYDIAGVTAKVTFEFAEDEGTDERDYRIVEE